MIIIMCGGIYQKFKEHKALSKINNEPLVARTIRLLKENNIDDIYISSNEEIFDNFGVPRLEHNNTYKQVNGKQEGYWLDAYFPTDKTCIYLHGDVYYSEDAIKKILNYNPKVNTMIGNQWALNENHDKVGEPFGWIIVDQKSFREAIDKTKKLQDEGKCDRMPVSWELYQVLNGHDVNGFDISTDTYLPISDITDDIDYPEQIKRLEDRIKNG